MAKFLNTKYPIRPKIEVYVYDVPILADEVIDSYEVTDECPEYEDLYGLYIPQFGHILLAVNSIDASLAQAILAHEYKHARQHLADEAFKECYADSFALHSLLLVQTNKNYETNK